MRSVETKARLQITGAGRDGSSFVDVLIGGAAITLILSMAVCGLPSIREVARRTSCKNNLRSLSVALHSYIDTNGLIPPGAVWAFDGPELSAVLNHVRPTPVELTRQNWVQFLLPHLNEMELASRFDATRSILDDVNAPARLTQLPVMQCPSDPYNRMDNPYRLYRVGQDVVEFSRGNYAINGGSEHVPASFGTLANPGPTVSRHVFSQERREFQWWGNGVAGINKCFALTDVRNGQAATVAIEEVRAGLADIDPRGVWALGQIGGSLTWGHGVTGDAAGPNYGSDDEAADDILRGPDLHRLLGTAFINAERMHCCDHCDENFQATARSEHPGGVQVVMLDGAVRFVSDEIEPTVWHVIHSRETPEALMQGRLDFELNGSEWDEASKSATSSVTPHESRNMPKEITNSIGMRLVRIAPGEFVMGLPNKGHNMPYPPDAVAHRVRITRGYYLGRCEVTQQEFLAVMGSNPSWNAATGAGGNVQTRGGRPVDTSHFPVENLPWADAARFCDKLSASPSEKAAGRKYRLPTEAEWEYACRAGTTDPIPLDDPSRPIRETGEIGSKGEEVPSDQRSVAVGSYPANPFGLSDMCGNVYEWVNDFRRHGYYARSPLTDPQGPSNGYFRVIRGWHWVATGPRCKVYAAQEPWTGSRFIGFRVATDICDTGDDTTATAGDGLADH